MIIKLILSLLIITVTLSCGSRDIQYEEFSAEILDGLKKKKQNECLASKAAIIQTWKDKWLTIYASDAMKEDKQYVFVYNVDAETDVKQTVKLTIIDKPVTPTDSISFLAENEDINDGDVVDYRTITYTQDNHNDHIQLLISEACLAENPVIDNNKIQFERDFDNKTDTYNLLEVYPALFARYLSFTREVRSGGTDEVRGTVSKTITLSNPTVNDLAGTPSSTSPTACEFGAITFDGVNPPGPPSDELDTVISSIGIREETGYDSCP